MEEPLRGKAVVFKSGDKSVYDAAGIRFHFVRKFIYPGSIFHSLSLSIIRLLGMVTLVHEPLVPADNGREADAPCPTSDRIH